MSMHIIDDRSPAVNYTGRWVPAGSGNEFNSTTSYAYLPGVTANVTFRGASSEPFCNAKLETNSFFLQERACLSMEPLGHSVRVSFPRYHLTVSTDPHPLITVPTKPNTFSTTNGSTNLQYYPTENIT